MAWQLPQACHSEERTAHLAARDSGRRGIPLGHLERCAYWPAGGV